MNFWDNLLDCLADLFMIFGFCALLGLVLYFV